jgi:hypothetical protein
LPRQLRFDAADPADGTGSPSGQRTGRRTLLLAAWAVLLAAVFAVALHSSADDGSAAAPGDAKVAGRVAAPGR